MGGDPPGGNGGIGPDKEGSMSAFAAAKKCAQPMRHRGPTQVGSAPAYDYGPAPPFFNKALDAWHKQREAWTQKPAGYKSVPKRPVLSVDITYDELLMTNKPFAQRIPLQEMVDFLVDCWEQEGLYD